MLWVSRRYGSRSRDTRNETVRSHLSGCVRLYGWPGGLLLLGFLTFPLFTRMLSRADYGAMSLINTSLSLLLLVFGLGLPNAVVRFFPQYSSGADNLYSPGSIRHNWGLHSVAAAGSTMLFAASFSVHPDAQNASLVKGFRCVMFVLD